MLSRDESDAVRAMARKMAGSSKEIARTPVEQLLTRCEGTVMALGDHGTIDVNVGSANNQMMLYGIQMLSGCAGAAVGDRVLIETLNHHSYAVGVVLNGNAGYVKPLFEWTNDFSGTVEGNVFTEKVQDIYVPGPVLCEVYAAVGGTGEYGMAFEFLQGGARKGMFSATSPQKGGGTLRWTANGVLTLEPGTYTVSATTCHWGSVSIVGGDSSGNSARPVDAGFQSGVPRYMRIWRMPTF